MASTIPRPPTLENPTEWAEAHIQSIYQANATQEEFDAAFDGFVAKGVKSIVFNGAKLTRDEYKQQIRKETTEARTVTVDFNDAVSAPSFKGDTVRFELI